MIAVADKESEEIALRNRRVLKEQVFLLKYRIADGALFLKQRLFSKFDSEVWPRVHACISLMMMMMMICDDVCCSSLVLIEHSCCRLLVSAVLRVCDGHVTAATSARGSPPKGRIRQSTPRARQGGGGPST